MGGYPPMPKVRLILPPPQAGEGRGGGFMHAINHEMIKFGGNQALLSVLYEGTVAQVSQRLLDLFLGVHHKRAIRENWLFERRARHQHESGM